LKPIIKWSGGKAQELKFFKDYFPKKFNQYIEPFSGGAAVFFELEHTPSIINDINYELVSLYKILSTNDKSFYMYLEKLSNKRKLITNKVSSFSKKDVLDIYKDSKRLDYQEIIINMKPFFSNLIEKSIKDKIKRIKAIEIKECKKFTVEELKEHIETSIQSALYFYARKIYNEKIDFNNLSFYIAHWYFVREFCYSSMFRFSKTGNFNVPYGGISYNKKNLDDKIKLLKSEKLHSLLLNTNIELLDFEELFKKYNYFEKEDFIFLDPPYDSEFSQYNKEKDFDKEEQIRLRNNLLKVNSKLMIVIKETDFILDLYKKDFNIIKFDKKYATNMRNRNNQDVVHLIITNY